MKFLRIVSYAALEAMDPRAGGVAEVDAGAIVDLERQMDLQSIDTFFPTLVAVQHRTSASEKLNETTGRIAWS